jgi:hypothetical protein
MKKRITSVVELKLSVSIGGSLQVKNAKGEWDWIKPEVGCEITLNNHEITESLQEQFAAMWDTVVGPQFKNVVSELIAEPVAPAEEETKEDSSDEDEKPNVDEDDYY